MITKSPKDASLDELEALVYTDVLDVVVPELGFCRAFTRFRYPAAV
ncbi:hypothetical protein OsccyDRAFT_1190 [Leptolyngbyaceae cyanobacterium JSC-12]|nr:hypothetical protein OsccyDRAFT_1190 [Leptolyngbyaceae cyanobacterium JSC-12]